MLSYTKFEKFMAQAEKMFRETEEFNDKYGFDVYEHFFGQVFDRAMDCIEEAMGDDTWISYFIYELNFGRDYEPGDVVDDNGDQVPLANVRDLYCQLAKDQQCM